MSERPRNAERSKAAILDAARRLFAVREISTVSLREIAAAAGVSHGLIQQYFGNREELVAEIIRREIASVLSASQHGAEPDDVRRMLRDGVEGFEEFAAIITRAELAGLEPEKMLKRSATTPAMHLASTIARMQSENAAATGVAFDPKLVSAYINAALFGFGALAPWLMTSAGLKPQDYRKRIDEIADITLALIELAGRRPPA